MPILPALATQLQCLFPGTDKGQERWRWFMLTLQAILVPITASRTSNLLRAITTLFGVHIGQSPYYSFMASVKLRWKEVWEVLWRAIPDPLTDGRLMIGLDDSVNAKTGRKVFACQTHLRPCRQDQPKPVPVGADDCHGGSAQEDPRTLELPAVGVRLLFPSPDVGCQMYPRAGRGRRLPDQVCPSGSPDQRTGQGLSQGSRSGGRGQLVRQQWVAHATDTKGNFVFDRTVTLDRSQSVLDMRRKR